MSDYQGNPRRGGEATALPPVGVSGWIHPPDRARGNPSDLRKRRLNIGRRGTFCVSGNRGAV